MPESLGQLVLPGLLVLLALLAQGLEAWPEQLEQRTLVRGLRGCRRELDLP